MNKKQRKEYNRRLEIQNEKLLENYLQATHDRDKLKSESAHYQEEYEKFKKKYFKELEREFLWNNKEIQTMSVMVPRDNYYDCFNSPVPKEAINEHKKRCIAQSFAEALYNLSDCLRVTENEIGTRYDFIVVKWGEDKKRKQEYEDLKMIFKEGAV